VVRRLQHRRQDNFPTIKVYGDVDTPNYDLSPCGGEFDTDANSYRDNIVVYAESVT
jgi:hypothetical protein